MDDVLTSVIDPVNKFLYTYLLVYVLAAAGLYFTYRTRAVQIRLFRESVRLILHSRTSSSANGVSSFQAFAIGLASRVGTGNIAGVAVALTLGGPGAVFWMWMVAAIGMATAFVEATLAQLYKSRMPDGSFRGGPATYIERGLGSRRWGLVFAVLLVLTFGIAFNMVQANTVADVLAGSHGVSQHWTALILMALSVPALFGGLRRISKIAEWVLPPMAGGYLLLALLLMLLHLGRVPGIIGDIVSDAFGFGPAAAGAVGSFSAALLNGVKRGLFSNEAGMGSAPNAAATADTTHPAKQGLIQALGVFVDTMVVCSATAFMILLADKSVYDANEPGRYTGASLTQAAIANQLGDGSRWILTAMVFVFAYSSVLGNYAYAEINLAYLKASPAVVQVYRLIVIAAVGVGSVLALNVVWGVADVAMAAMALINLVAITLLGRWAFGALRDYERQRAAGRDPEFVAAENTELPGTLVTDVW